MMSIDFFDPLRERGLSPLEDSLAKDCETLMNLVASETETVSPFVVGLVVAVAGGCPRPLYVAGDHLGCPDDCFCLDIDCYGYPK